MKAERRHELKENDLVHGAAKAVKVMQLPDLRRKLIGRIVAVIAVIVVIAVVIRMRISNAEQSFSEATEHLVIARHMVSDDLRNILPSAELDAKFFETVQLEADRINGELEKVSVTSDEKLLAQAALMKGDLNFYMANLPVGVAKSATQPAPGLSKSHDDYLTAAYENYNEVVAKYGDQPLNVMSAHFGLAAVAENRSNWDEAVKHYDAVLMNENSGPAFKSWAQARKVDLTQMRQPLLLERSAMPALVSTTQMSGGATSATMPSTMAATLPAEGSAKTQATTVATTNPMAATAPATQPVNASPTAPH